MKWQDILKSTALSYVNHGLTLLFVYLSQKGLRADAILTEANILVLAGAVVTGAGSAVMIIVRKLKARNLVQAAREAEPGARMTEIKAAAAEMPLVK